MPSKGYRPDIDGLRAVAVFSVVAYHVGLPFFRGGFVGVDIFFVISGYLICSLIYREIRQGDFSFAKFYTRRAKRILPALYVLLVFWYAIACVLLSPLEIKAFAQDALATLLSASNIRFWLTAGYFSVNSLLNPLLMTWSLGVEEQFYIFFPILMVVLVKIGRKRLFLTIFLFSLVSFAFAAWDVRLHPPRAFYLLPSRAWELGAGTLLALYEARAGSYAIAGKRWLSNLSGFAGFALIAAAVAFYDKNTLFPGLAAAVPVAGAVLLILANGSAMNRALSAKPIVFMGLVSYSWYLWHWPMLSFARILSDHGLSLTLASLIAAASFGIAVLSYRYVEQPLRRSKLSSRSTLIRYGVASLAMMVPALLLHHSGGWPQRFPGINTVEQGTAALVGDPCLAPYGRTTPNLSAKCVSAGNSQNSVALIGDSHAGAIANYLKAEATANHMGFYQLTKASCQPLSEVTRWMNDHPRLYAECAAFNNNVLKLVQDNPHIKVVLVVGYWSGSLFNASLGERYLRTGQTSGQVTPEASVQNLQFGLDNLVRKLEASGKQVMLLKDVPSFLFDPRRHVLTNFIPVRRRIAGLLFSGDRRYTYSVPRGEAISPEDEVASKIVDSVASSEPGTKVFDPKVGLCDQSACYFDDGVHLLYDDIEHVSPQGADLALKGLTIPGWM